MRQFHALALATAFSLSFYACSKTDEMQAKIDEYAPIFKNPQVKEPGDDPKKAEVIALLNREYPGAPPISQDSAQRVLQANLPDTIGHLSRATKDLLEYDFAKEVAKDNPSVKKPAERYFNVFAQYNTKRSSPSQPTEGFLMMILDHGYYPRWVNRFISNQVEKGENIIFDFIRMGQDQEYQKTIDYQGHKWALWKSKPRPAKYKGETLPLPTVSYVTVWNDRFPIIIHSSDTARVTPDYTERIINYAWLEKLGYN